MYPWYNFAILKQLNLTLANVFQEIPNEESGLKHVISKF